MALNVSMPVQNQIGFYENVNIIENASGKIYIHPDKSLFNIIKPVGNLQLYFHSIDPYTLKKMPTDSLMKVLVYFDTSDMPSATTTSNSIITNTTIYNLTFDPTFIYNYSNLPTIKLQNLFTIVIQLISYNRGKHWKLLTSGFYNKFSTITASVNVPIINTPTLVYYDSVTNTNTLTFTSSSPSLSNGTAIHYASDWEFATDSNFNNLIYSTYEDTKNLTSITISDLVVGQEYFIRVKYRCFAANTNWSNSLDYINDLMS